MTKNHAVQKFIRSLERVHLSIAEGLTRTQAVSAEINRIADSEGWTAEERAIYRGLINSIWTADIWTSARARRNA